ncbi:MAG: hypothetical protein K2M47_01580 [Clostridiales bacterium]|nr:hypothetical protein [Clostridiales bacterium]
MKRNEHVKPVMGKSKVWTYIAAAVIALMIFAVGAFVGGKPKTAANAETGGTVTVHVYDPNMNYSELGGWFWIKGGASGIHGQIKPATADEPFYKEYENNGTTVKNSAYTFTLSFSATEIESLKNGIYFGMLICKVKGTTGDFNDRYIKETSDVLLDLSTAFDDSNHADIYYVRKDATAYMTLEEALQTLEKITSARFTKKTASNATVTFEVTTPIKSGAKARLYNGKDLIGEAAVTIGDNSCQGIATFNTVFDFSVDYIVMVDGVPASCSVSKTAFIDDETFIKTYESADTQNQEYGCFYTPTKTTFRVWAPFASAVTLRIYRSGTSGQPEAPYAMEKYIPAGGTWGGVWVMELNGNYKGRYYTYVVNNNGVETETIDPYAKACGANGMRGMVVDLASTDPDGWAADKDWYKTNAVAVDTPIVWEVAVSDFSSSADSGMKYKGKYLAFTEKGTTVPGKPNLKTGLDYLKELGITYVHLNPVYDFATVDESDMTRADSGNFNWGYDPQNYNIPEGSYSTDPSDGAVRINEFKRMVKALHDAGIGVVMDVVYNHTYTTGGQALHDTVPYYYHRTDEYGAFTDGSGCGNETASERTMVRKYIVESIKYWAEEYHIDGFRFDLMGIHDVKTLNMVRAELDSLPGGSRLLIYGEPWSADGDYTPDSYTKRVNATKNLTLGKYTGNSNNGINSGSNGLMKHTFFAGFGDTTAFNALSPRIAVFNGSGRDGLRGECSNRAPTKGWVNGNPGAVSSVRKMVEGGIGGWDYGAAGLHVGLGSRNVAYACAHDNYTLWDHIRGAKHGNESALYYDDPVADDVKRCKLVASAYMMSTGMCFMIAGEEMGRTKYGNENSYNSPTKLNQISWSRQEAFKDLHDYYKSLIALRKQYSTQLFSYSKSTVENFSYGTKAEGDGYTGLFEFERTQNGAKLTLSLNPSTLKGTVTIGTTTLSIK